MRNGRPLRQRGVAIITALVVVAAATVAVAAMLWRQSIAVRKMENQADLGQARWLARSSIDWARLLLQLDARTSTVDHLGEIWATPLEETRVSEDLGESPGAGGNAPASAPSTPDDAQDAYVSGRMRDAQARFNLTGLAADGKVDESRRAILGRLLKTLGLRDELGDAIAGALAREPAPTTFDEVAETLAADGGTGPATLERLRPYVVMLPSPTPVNLNTASAEVIAACFDDLPLDVARALVRSREQAWFNQVGDAAARLPGSSGNVANGAVSVSSRFFELAGRVRIGRADIDLSALIERDPGGATRVRSFVER